MLECTQCHQTNPVGARFCEACGSQLDDPIAKEREADEVEASFMLDQVKRARGALIVVAALGAIGGALEVATAAESEQGLLLAINAVVWGGFVGLWWWASKRPLAAAITGLLVFVSLHAMAAIGDPRTIVSGIVVKIVITVVLVRAIIAGFKHRAFVRSKGLD